MTSDEPGLGPLQETSWGQKENEPGEELQCRAKGSIQGPGPGLETGTPAVLKGQGRGEAPGGAGQG